ncbi:hypothetical protein RCH10_005608 [Variovorax sp. GrIS 2.14]
MACARPCAIQDGAETPSTISLKQASTIAEIRTAVQAGRRFLWLSSRSFYRIGSFAGIA